MPSFLHDMCTQICNRQYPEFEKGDKRVTPLYQTSFLRCKCEAPDFPDPAGFSGIVFFSSPRQSSRAIAVN